jgi:hypothetical protein
MLKKTLLPALVLVAALATTATALATAPPVGPLPKGPTSTIAAKSNRTFIVRLPKSQQPGLVWRLARNYRSSVVRGLDEGETKDTVWLRFKSVAPGKTSLVFALTRGERARAFAARTFIVTVK